MVNKQIKTILVLPPSYPGRQRTSSAPPLSLLYLGTFLKESHYPVSIIDADINGYYLDDLAKEIVWEKPDLIGINVMTVFIGTVLNLAERIKKFNPEIKIILGGPHITATGDETLKLSKDIDFLAIGEGEYTLLELVKTLVVGSTDFSGIKGLIYRQGNNIVRNPFRELIQDLDSLPFSDISLIKDFNINNYELFYSGGKKVINLLASRGCPFNCSFCSAHLTHGKKPRLRSVKNVINEIIYNQQKYGIGYIAFKDSTFTFNRVWLKEFCQQIIEKNINMNWVCNARVDTVDEEIIKLMSEAGCNAVGFGVESGSQRILDILQKGTKIKDIIEVYQWLKKYKITPLAAIMIGNPTETKEDLDKTYKLAVAINPLAIGFNVLTAFPGTKIYYDALADGSLKNPTWYLKPKNEKGDYPLLGYWDGKLTLLEFDPEVEIDKITRHYYFRPFYIFSVIKDIFSNPYLLKYAFIYAFRVIKKRLHNA